jgi:hypothetical protein
LPAVSFTNVRRSLVSVTLGSGVRALSTRQDPSRIETAYGCSSSRSATTKDHGVLAAGAVGPEPFPHPLEDPF